MMYKEVCKISKKNELYFAVCRHKERNNSIQTKLPST